MTIFDVLTLCGLIFGTVLGYRFGAHAGAVVGVLGAALGAAFGLILARLPYLLALISTKRSLRRRASSDLRALLADPHFLAPNVVLLELKSRGEDISDDLPQVLDMLVDSSQQRRRRGWHALASAFPEVARRLGDYRNRDTVENCKEKIARVRSEGSGI